MEVGSTFMLFILLIRVIITHIYYIKDVAFCRLICDTLIEFFCKTLFSAKSWQNSTSIDIQWVAITECQYWRYSARIWQKMTNYRKIRSLSKYYKIYKAPHIHGWQHVPVQSSQNDESRAIMRGK